MKANDWISVVIAIAICEAAGIAGSLLMGDFGGWYATLAKPALNPPSWIFGPVWTLLYALMGIAAALVWKRGWGRKEVKQALGIFVIQLACNAAWSPIFFGLHDPTLALGVVALLWLAIIGTMVLFARVSRVAAWLLTPYLLWVTFAIYLNLSIVLLNP